MENLLQVLRQLNRWQRLAVGALLVLILATWVAVCFILASYL
jgi:hypothetical protein